MKDGRWRMWRTRMAGGNEHISPCFMIFVAPISILSKNSHTYDIQTLHPRFLRLLILEWFPFALRILFFLMSRGSLFQQWIIFSHIKGGPHRPHTKRTVNRKCLCNLCLYVRNWNLESRQILSWHDGWESVMPSVVQGIAITPLIQCFGSIPIMADGNHPLQDDILICSIKIPKCQVFLFRKWAMQCFSSMSALVCRFDRGLSCTVERPKKGNHKTSEPGPCFILLVLVRQAACKAHQAFTFKLG